MGSDPEWLLHRTDETGKDPPTWHVSCQLFRQSVLTMADDDDEDDNDDDDDDDDGWCFTVTFVYIGKLNGPSDLQR